MKNNWEKYLHGRFCARRFLALLVCFALLLCSVPAAAAAGSANNRTVRAGVFFFDGCHMRDNDGNYTGYDWKEIEHEAAGLGVTHFMPKPFFLSSFKETVRLMMGRAREAKQQDPDVVRGMHILVVDDIEVNRIILVKILAL